MIEFSSVNWFSSRRRGRPMAVLCPGAILMLALFAAGCSKSKPAPVEVSAPPPTVENTNAAPTTMPVGAAPVPTKIELPPSTAGTPDLKAINQAYIGWMVQNRQRPKNLDEFIALSGIHLPPAPAGKKYVIDKNGFINFANQ